MTLVPHLLSALPILQLAQAAADSGAAPARTGYVPFLRPLPVWSDAIWPFLLLPLCIAVSIVYKSIKCRTMADVPREAAKITVWIIGGMVLAAAVLALVVHLVDYSRS